MKEIIMDLGVGEAGGYLEGISENVDYYCVDMDINGLEQIRNRFKKEDGSIPLHVIRAAAESLPFKSGVFDRINILFPTGSLLAPGLQPYRLSPPGWDDKPVEVRGQNFYEKLARVLKDGGQLIVYGDWMVCFEGIISKKEFEPYFKFVSKQFLSDSDLISIGTRASRSILGRRELDEETPAYKVIFQKRLK